MVFQGYKKDEIASGMLETALDLYFNKADGFSIIHLAAASEEVLAGLLKSKKKESLLFQTAREKAISALKEIHKVRGNNRTEKEIGTFFNFVRNKTKHHDNENDSNEISICLDLEVDSALSRAIENYVLYFSDPTEKMLRYINSISLYMSGRDHR